MRTKTQYSLHFSCHEDEVIEIFEVYGSFDNRSSTNSQLNYCSRQLPTSASGCHLLQSHIPPQHFRGENKQVNQMNLAMFLFFFFLTVSSVQALEQFWKPLAYYAGLISTQFPCKILRISWCGLIKMDFIPSILLSLSFIFYVLKTFSVTVF